MIEFNRILFNGIFDRNNLIFLYCISALISSYYTAISPSGGDFDAFIEAANKFKQNISVYSSPYENYGKQYYYSIFFAWILSYFSSYPILCKFFWCFFSFGLLFRIYKLIFTYLGINYLSKINKIKWVLTIGILSLNSITDNISRMQMSILIVWIIFESYNFTQKNKKVLASTLLALGINIKILPIMVMPYYLIKGEYKLLVYTVVLVLVLYLIPAFAIGFEINFIWLKQWWEIINPQNYVHTHEFKSIGVISISSLISNYFIDSTNQKGFLTTFIQLDLTSARLLYNLIRIAFFTLFFMTFYRVRSLKTPLSHFYILSILTLLISILFPHQQRYAALFVLPSIAYLLYYNIHLKSNTYSFKVYLFIISCILFSPIYGRDILGSVLFDYIQIHKFQTISILCIFFVLISSLPNTLQANQNED
jgi:hypothetical protein